MVVIALLEVIELPAEIGVALLLQEFEATFEVLDIDEQAVLGVDGLLAGAEVEVVLVAHDDGLLRADILAEAAVDAAEHVDLEGLGVALLGIGGFAGLHADRQWRAGAGAQAAGDAALLAMLLHEDGPPPELRPQHGTLFRIPDGDLLAKHVLEGERHTFCNFHVVELVHKTEVTLIGIAFFDTHRCILFWK